MGLFGGSGGETGSAIEGQQQEQSFPFSSAANNAVNATAMNNSSLSSGRTMPQCQEYSKLFMDCMNLNNNQYEGCKDYMEMMKACQQQYS